MKKKVSCILFLIGLLPFVVLIIGGIYASIEGYSPVFMSYLHHGWDAFGFFVQDFLGVFWPFCILGILLIIVSVILRINGKK